MDEPRFQLTRGDAVAWLRTLPSESIDLVVTDPPYESLEKYRAIGTTTRLKHSKASSNDWFEIFPNDRFPELFAEIYRVLKDDRHFYLYCDQETMFVAKPLAEQAGFKFWKPIIWDKCLGPDTPVWTERGVQRIADIVEGDRVALPEGGSTTVKATRRTRALSLKLSLSDGTSIIASREHRFVRGNGEQCEAKDLVVGDGLLSRPVQQRIKSHLRMDDVIPEEDAVYALPETSNDVPVWYPRDVSLDYDLGKTIGLYAAEGNRQPCSGIAFAFHADEKHLHSHVARTFRALGIHAIVAIDGNSAVVHVNFKLAEHLVSYFVGGSRATSKYFKPTVYEAPAEFRRGILAGLLEGDGHWSHDEQRETFTSTSHDLTMFVRRELSALGRAPTIQRAENDHAGYWRVRFDPRNAPAPVSVTGIEDIGEQELVDISVTDPSELFLLANGVVTHNCKIGMGYHYRARYECILFFEKGKRKLNDLGVADIIQQARVNGGYPAEKPPEVASVLITQSTQPGELVIDPFMGSGSSGVAAITNGRQFMGNDLCQEAIDITRGRLLGAGAKEPLELPVESAATQLGLMM